MREVRHNEFNEIVRILSAKMELWERTVVLLKKLQEVINGFVGKSIRKVDGTFTKKFNDAISPFTGWSENNRFYCGVQKYSHYIGVRFEYQFFIPGKVWNDGVFEDGQTRKEICLYFNLGKMGDHTKGLSNDVLTEIVIQENPKPFEGTVEEYSKTLYELIKSYHEKRERYTKELNDMYDQVPYDIANKS